MYKIVNISDLNRAVSFKETDKVVEVTSDHSKMKVAENDYTHKSNSYIAECIGLVDGILRLYINAINTIEETYLTASLDQVYMPDGSLIKKTTLDKILQSDAFLTKAKCKDMESALKKLIHDSKNKAVSTMMVLLNQSFIAQNSAGKLAYGQYAKNKASEKQINYDARLSQLETWPSPHKPTGQEKGYNFTSGEFTLPRLLFGNTVNMTDDKGVIPFYPKDVWEEYYIDATHSFTNLGNASTILTEFDNDGDKKETCYIMNRSGSKYEVVAPNVSLNYYNQSVRTIPVASLAYSILRRQISKAIQTVCNVYLAKMTSVPRFSKVAAK